MARKAPKKSFDPDAFGTMAPSKSLEAAFGGGGVEKITADKVFCERVNAISVYANGLVINTALRGIKITIPGLDLPVSGTTSTLVLPVGYPDNDTRDDNFYQNRPVSRADTYVYIKAGTNVGEIRQVLSYDSSIRELTFASTFTSAIDATSQFEIIDGVDVTTDIGGTLLTGDYIPMIKSPFIFLDLTVTGEVGVFKA